MSETKDAANGRICVGDMLDIAYAFHNIENFSWREEQGDVRWVQLKACLQPLCSMLGADAKSFTPITGCAHGLNRAMVAQGTRQGLNVLVDRSDSSTDTLAGFVTIAALAPNRDDVIKFLEGRLAIHRGLRGDAAP